MSICTSGASEPKPNVADTVTIGTSVLVATLAPELLWLEPFVALTAQVFTTYLPDFCAIDPPADPGLSGTDIVAIVAFGDSNPDPGPMRRLKQLIARGVWNAVCQCTSGPAPTVTLPSTPPAGTPDINPPSVTNDPTIGNCMVVVLAHSFFDSDSVNHIPQWQTGVLYQPHTTPDASLNLLNTKLPVGANTVTVTMTNDASGGAHVSDLNFGAFFYNNAGTQLTSVNGVATPGQTTKVSGAIPATATNIALVAYGGNVTANTNGISGHAEVTCNGGPGQLSTPCCPPDPIAAGLLTSILQAVTLIQRQLAPFSSIHGAAHAGLSGNGQFPVQGLLGLAVDVTTMPGRAGLVAGDPDQLFDVGWITVGTADGWGPRHFISSDPFLLSPVAGDATLVGYSIPGDVTVTITEIVREP